MLLKASSSFMTALVALAGSSSGNLRVVAASPADTRNPSGAQYVPSVNSVPTAPATTGGGNAPGALATDAQVAALINTSTRVLTMPAGYSGMWWLEICQSWLQLLAGTAAPLMPQQGGLLLSSECGADFQGAYAAAFQASPLSFTSYTPAVSGPWPVIAG